MWPWKAVAGRGAATRDHATPEDVDAHTSPPFRATFRGVTFSIPVPRSGAQYGALYEVMEAARWR